MDMIKGLCTKLKAEDPAYQELTAKLKADPNVACLKSRLKEEEDPEKRAELIEIGYDLLISRLLGDESKLSELFLTSAARLADRGCGALAKPPSAKQDCLEGGQACLEGGEDGLLTLESALSLISSIGLGSDSETEEASSETDTDTESETEDFGSELGYLRSSLELVSHRRSGTEAVPSSPVDEDE